MDPITSGLVTNLLAAGLLNRVEAGRQQLHAVFREAEFHTELDAIETEFHTSLRDAIADGATEQELDEFADIVEHWDAVIERLEATSEGGEEDITGRNRLIFENETEAVDRLAREIAAVCGYELGTNPQLQQALKRAIAEAYRETVGSFGERLVETGLDAQFVAEANIEELGALDQLQDRLADLEERLTHPRFYELYRGDEAGRRRASRMVDPQALEFVSRPELEGKQAAQRLLVLGSGGSGKSRVLAELVANADPAIEHIIRPKAALQSPQDLQPLRSEAFQGDVLLVWDDIHAISPETNNTVFRKAVTELEEFLAPDHELHVLAAARSNRVDSLPGEISPDSSLWLPFEDVWLEAIEEEAIATLIEPGLTREFRLTVILGGWTAKVTDDRWLLDPGVGDGRDPILVDGVIEGERDAIPRFFGLPRKELSIGTVPVGLWVLIDALLCEDARRFQVLAVICFDAFDGVDRPERRCTVRSGSDCVSHDTVIATGNA
ncbi:hypothetical protein [Halocatena pleomorpha]|uniref:Uncharacterized protein n=1 Tax=Halocatena pleomorpha TaxID=1785090 RepID=A0A3P3R916_9EURY|nr:hypothetical protein [Halocatena pleomorpha]RRJ29947.1 hypothetical protein EIK79_11380 [Halocatena pleomorpha]